MTAIDKQILIKRMAQSSGSNEQEALVHLNAFIEVIAAALQAGEKVNIEAFGSFAKIVKPQRVGKVPGSQEPLVFPASYVTQFDADKLLKTKLNRTV